ncbi:hypothetical protein ELJ07_32085, partial [Klebsiella pneumoniae]|nr:hypothetical protein [Klebsiella pneumoniae]
MGTVSGPVIPMVSAGYKTPSSISNVSSTSGFSGATLSKSTNESRPSNNVQNATPAVIENVIVIDSTEVVRAIGDKIDIDQGKRIVNQ